MESLLARELLTFGGRHLSFILLIFLVGDEEDQRVGLALVLYFLEPVR